MSKNIGSRLKRWVKHCFDNKYKKLKQSVANEWRVFTFILYKRLFFVAYRQRPYHVESTGSRPITEVKQRRARLVLGWVTAWEHRVLLATYFSFSVFILLFFFFFNLNCLFVLSFILLTLFFFFFFFLHFLFVFFFFFFFLLQTASCHTTDYLLDLLDLLTDHRWPYWPSLRLNLC